ncbi:allantoinase PuuE [Lichenifustis flavocetrariae]|uniref:Chitooligosaccharide deacetylase n=1 Tax=Lichenifustis flavocetrariae TaxID=2949735 RepID=A0AA41Z4F8_9HYPH|nr:allantoinase PuuE [Lichenifustis flavocetrariae]MCW6509072.1 allantoinase PuuE [Lichenifustis flavocetrariae]
MFDLDQIYPRDMVGYGRNPPKPNWPGRGRVAVQFVINYEEGGENNILHGDAASEAFLSEIVGAQPWPGQRHVNMESIYEYGSRVGFWRLWRMFTARKMPVTVYAVASAMVRNPEAVAAMNEAGWEIATHGLKWIDYRNHTIEAERADIDEAIGIHTAVAGARPLGLYQGRTSSQTLQIGAQEGGFLYLADTYADELPYWQRISGRQQLIVPYTLDANDMRFATPQGFNTGDHFFAYLKDSFDVLYREGGEGHGGMMSIGLHCRLVGRPGRAAALERFLDYVQSHEHAWVATRLGIARHWVKHHPPKEGFRPSQMGRALFVEVFGGIFEHTPAVAERAYAAGIWPSEDTTEGLHRVLVAQMRAMSAEDQDALIKAHPDLAGRLALAGELTASSAGEQASAGLDRLSTDELQRFTTLNTAYRERFGFPFIIAVKGKNKADILQNFEVRLANTVVAERAEALMQIERIARLRLDAIRLGQS